MAHTSVKITSNSSDYQASMKSCAQATKVLAAEYGTAATRAKEFGTVTDQLKVKAEGLTEKIKVQKQIVDLNAGQQEKLTQKLSSQKTEQEALKKKIDDTKSAYEKSAEETGKNSEQSKALKEELDKLEQEYTKNESAIGKTETALANQTVKTEKSKTALIQMESELKKTNSELRNHGVDVFTGALDKAGEKIESVGKKMMTVTAGTAGVVTAAGKMAMSFEDDMAKVSTIMDENVMSTDEMSEAILSLSNETGIAAGDIADNVYNAISAGQKTGDAVNFVRESTKLATAGFADSGSTLDVLTTILNAYGMSASEVTNVSDMLIQTQNLGKTTVADLSSAMGKVIPTANANGVALDQLCTGYAIMTANGVATAETTTYMNSMLNELGKTGSTTDEVLREKTGKSFKELMESGSSLADVLDIVNGAAEEQNLSMSDMFSSAEAAKAGLILLGDSSSSFNNTLKDMRSSTGATDTAFEKMKTTSYDSKVAMNELKNTAIKFGQTIMTSAAPMVEGFTEKIHELTEWFGSLDEGQQQTILKAGLLVAAVGPTAIAFGKVTTGISSTVKAGQSFVNGVAGIIAKITGKTAATVAETAATTAGTAATAASTTATTAGTAATVAQTTATTAATTATTALGVAMRVLQTVGIIALITGIVAGIVLLVKNFDKVKETVSNLWGHIKNVFSGIKDTITGAFTKAKEAVTEKLSAMKNAIANSKIGQAAQTAFSAIKSTASNVMSAAHATIKEKLGNIKTAYQEAGGGIKGVVAAGMEGVKGYFTAGLTFVDNLTGGKLSAIKEKFTGKISEIKSKVSEGWSNMKETVKNKMTEWKDTASEKLTSLKEKFTSKTSEIKSKWQADFTDIKDKATNLMENAKTNVKTKLDNMKTAYQEAGGGIKGVSAAAFSGIKDNISNVMSGINTLTGGKLDSIKNAFQSKLASAKSSASSAMSGIREAFSSKMEGARSVVSGALEKVKNAFKFKWNLPELKLPHISVSGGKAPYGIAGKGSLPKFNIEWYKNGGIMTNPTVFGVRGDTIMMGGEAGDEAILPLAQFYTTLNKILDRKLDTIKMQNVVYVTAHTYIDGDEVASRTVSKVDEALVNDERKRR